MKSLENFLNRVICGDCNEVMDQFPADCIDLIITSPPYNVGMEYETVMPLDQYMTFMEKVLAKCYDVLVPGGRICIVVGDTGRKPYIPLHSHLTQSMLNLGFLMRGMVVWNKGVSAKKSTAWGSWRSATNPVLRDISEYILIFCKDSFYKAHNGRRSTISKEEFMRFTKSVWDVPTASAKRIGHPAPFPEELIYGLIQLYSFENDIVLDPMCGSGTTCIVAKKTGRRYIGIDNIEDYCKLAERRLASI